MAAEALKGNYTLRIGESFNPHSKCRFSTFRYDFLPASVDQSKPGLVEVGATDDVTVSLAHGTSSTVSHTIFKGHKRPCQKECVLILDKKTGEARLERVSMTVTLKKARIDVCQMDLVEKKLKLKAGASHTPDTGKQKSASTLSPSKRPSATQSGSSSSTSAIKQADKKTDKQADKKTDKQADKKTDKQRAALQEPVVKKKDKKDKSDKKDKKLELLERRDKLEKKDKSDKKESKKDTFRVKEAPSIKRKLTPPRQLPGARAASSSLSSSSSSLSSDDSDFEPVTHPVQKSKDKEPTDQVSLQQLKDDLQLSESGSDSD